MARWFNIGGPCNAAENYTLPAMERLPEVAALVRKGQYFVVHAPRQCGKTTAFLSFANEANAKLSTEAKPISRSRWRERSRPRTWCRTGRRFMSSAAE